MIIACPACDTRYAVPEAAIGGEGRTVRCAKCKHSWFQEPKPLDLDASIEAKQLAPEPAVAPTPPPPPAPPPPVQTAEPKATEPPEAPVSETQTPKAPSEGIAGRALMRGLGKSAPVEEPEPEPSSISAFVPEETDEPPALDADSDPLAQENTPDYVSEADELYDTDFESDYSADYSSDYADDGEVSQFDYSPPFTARRNPIKMWSIAAGVFALLATGTIVAVNYYGLPDWFPIEQPTFGIGQEELELDFPKPQQRTEELENGEEIFRVRGSITNIGRESVAVPNLLVVFRDERNRRVQDSVIVPAKKQLAPGESLNVTEAIADIPANANAAEIGWARN